MGKYPDKRAAKGKTGGGGTKTFGARPAGGARKPKPPSLVALKNRSPYKPADLAPDAAPTGASAAPATANKRKRKPRAEADETPRAFRRLMDRKDRIGAPKAAAERDEPARPGRGTPAGGAAAAAAGGTAGGTAAAAAAVAPAPELKIRKGESMGDFSRRVNDAIPLAKAKGVDSAKAQKTSDRQKAKAERLRGEYKDRLNRRRGRSEDDAGEDLDEANWARERRDSSPDPFAHLQAPKPKFGDYADAPPQLPALRKLTNVPKAAGSLIRRQQLEQERQQIIDAYRKQKAQREGAREPAAPLGEDDD